MTNMALVDILRLLTYGSVEVDSQSLKQRYGEVLEELGQYRALYDFMRQKPYPEAHEIFMRIRSSEEPIKALHSITTANTLFRNPSSSSSDNAKLQEIDAEALAQSMIRVPSRPWTAVAGDGMVSELITNFFSNDHGYLVPFIHRGSFLKDMRAMETDGAEYCSATLVNAICALKCLTSQRARTVGRLTAQDMTETFLSEAKRLFELESGRQSLTSAQAACVMYLTLALLGRDRAGQMYRYMGYEMLKRLRLDRKFATLRVGNQEEALTRLGISKTLWGLFCFESRMSYFYSEPSLISPPSVPNLFDEGMEWQDAEDTTPPPDSPNVMTPGLFRALCNVSEISYEIMKYNASVLAVGRSTDNVIRREELYSKLRGFERSLRDSLRPDKNFTVHTCYLQFVYPMHITESAMSVLQLLPPDYLLKDDEVTVKELCFRRCEADSRLAERYLQMLTPDSVLGRCLYVALSALLPFLNEPEVQDLFTRYSFMLRACVSVAPLFKLLLMGIEGAVKAMGNDIPEDARPCFEKLDGIKSTDDLPVSFSLPQRDEVRRVLAGDGDDEASRRLGVDLTTLISKWLYFGIGDQTSQA